MICIGTSDITGRFVLLLVADAVTVASVGVRRVCGIFATPLLLVSATTSDVVPSALVMVKVIGLPATGFPSSLQDQQQQQQQQDGHKSNAYLHNQRSWTA
jgi:hypothetical protein